MARIGLDTFLLFFRAFSLQRIDIDGSFGLSILGDNGDDFKD